MRVVAQGDICLVTARDLSSVLLSEHHKGRITALSYAEGGDGKSFATASADASIRCVRGRPAF